MSNSTRELYGKPLPRQPEVRAVWLREQARRRSSRSRRPDTWRALLQLERESVLPAKDR